MLSGLKISVIDTTFWPILLNFSSIKARMATFNLRNIKRFLQWSSQHLMDSLVATQRYFNEPDVKLDLQSFNCPGWPVKWDQPCHSRAGMSGEGFMGRSVYAALRRWHQWRIFCSGISENACFLGLIAAWVRQCYTCRSTYILFTP